MIALRLGVKPDGHNEEQIIMVQEFHACPK